MNNQTDSRQTPTPAGAGLLLALLWAAPAR